MRIDVEARGVDRAMEELERRADRALASRPVMAAAVDAILDLNRARFDSQRGWARLDPATVADKGGGRPLVASGVLRASLTRRGAAGQRIEVTADRVSVATTVPYARYHQTGTRHMPRRNLTGVDRRDLPALAELLARHLRGPR